MTSEVTLTRLYKVHLLDSMAHIIANILEYLLYFPETKFIDNRITGVFPCRAVVKNPPPNAGDIRDTGLIPGSRRSLGEGLATTPVFLPRKFHGQKTLEGYSPWCHKKSDLTDHTLTLMTSYIISKKLL